MKVVKWGVHGTGTCTGPGILLLIHDFDDLLGIHFSSFRLYIPLLRYDSL